MDGGKQWLKGKVTHHVTVTTKPEHQHLLLWSLDTLFKISFWVSSCRGKSFQVHGEYFYPNTPGYLTHEPKHLTWTLVRYFPIYLVTLDTTAFPAHHARELLPLHPLHELHPEPAAVELHSYRTAGRWNSPAVWQCLFIHFQLSVNVAPTSSGLVWHAWGYHCLPCGIDMPISPQWAKDKHKHLILPWKWSLCGQN